MKVKEEMPVCVLCQTNCDRACCTCGAGEPYKEGKAKVYAEIEGMTCDVCGKEPKLVKVYCSTHAPKPDKDISVYEDPLHIAETLLVDIKASAGDALGWLSEKGIDNAIKNVFSIQEDAKVIMAILKKEKEKTIK